VLFARWEPEAMAAAWRAARPFPHVVLDDLLPEAEVAALRAAVAREPHFPNSAPFFEFMASRQPLAQPELRAFTAALDEARPFVARVTGKALGRVELRSYVYLAGSFLLPHNDAGADARRQVAFAYYLLPRAGSTGGELELFDCTLEGEELVAAASALRIAPEENRMVLFDVSHVSLHQVREVLSGARASLSGWFYP
jgi:2-oxoglutarate-Fe(II)-dependent oxygenase superfamily protein